MVVLWLFVKYLTAFIAVVVFYEWLVGWLSHVTTAEAVFTFIAAVGAVSALIFLVANRRKGVIVAVAVIVFWSLVMFGAAGTTAMRILAGAAVALAVAAVVALFEFLMRRRVTGGPT